MAFERVITGQEWSPPEAVEWNTLMDLAVNRLPPAQRPVKSRPLAHALEVRVKNTSGSNCHQWEILGIDDAHFDPSSQADGFKLDIVLDGVTPDDATHREKWVVCAEPIPNGEYGRAWIGGMVPVQIDVVHADHDYADVKDNDRAKLKSGFAGSARIIYKQSGTGTRWAYVMFHVRDYITIKVTPDSTVTAGSSQTCTVWKNGSATTATETVHLNWMHGSQNISADKECTAAWSRDENKWWFNGADCE